MPVLLVDLGIALSGIGLLSLLWPLRFLGIRTRRRALAVLLAGVLLVPLGMFLPPPPERQVVRRASLLDDFMPRYAFVEHHELRVHAPPARAYDAVLQVTARDIRFFRLLVWLRSPHLPGRGGETSVMNPDADRPILETAVRGGFLPLAEDPGREVVLGAIVAAPAAPRSLEELRSRTPEWFVHLDRPGFAKATINFLVTDEGGGWSRVTTETRIEATDREADRRFAAYWRVIYPGSWTIRYYWLRAIRDRAERPAPA
jgi:hypothetical protein